VNSPLTSFLEGTGGLGDRTSKQPFHCQQILLNWNEVVDGFPFGKPVIPIFGFGGIFGAQLLQEKTFLSSNTSMVSQVVNDLLKNYSEHNSSILKMLGLKRLEGSGNVVVSINNRMIGPCDAEHGCCINYVILERGTGGTKGLSSKPKLTSTFCHGINGGHFRIEEANSALDCYMEVVDSKLWPGLVLEEGEGDCGNMMHTIPPSNDVDSSMDSATNSSKGLAAKRSRSSMENDDYELEEEDGSDSEKDTVADLEFMISSRDNLYPIPHDGATLCWE
jgi:hypothetical protein